MVVQAELRVESEMVMCLTGSCRCGGTVGGNGDQEKRSVFIDSESNGGAPMEVWDRGLWVKGLERSVVDDWSVSRRVSLVKTD